MDSNIKLRIEPSEVLLRVLESSGRIRKLKATLDGFVDMNDYTFEGKIHHMELIPVNEENDKIREVIKILESLLT